MGPSDILKKALVGSGNVNSIRSQKDFKSRSEITFSVVSRRAFTPVIDFILAAEEREGCVWNVHLCGQYVRENGKLGQIYFLAVHSKGDLIEAANRIAEIVDLVKVSNVAVAPAPNLQKRPMKTAEVQGSYDGYEVTSMPLVGGNRRRNEPGAAVLSSGSKGAHFIPGK